MDKDGFDENIEETGGIVENSADTDEANAGEHSSYRPDSGGDPITHKLTGMYQNWFLDYASYVILERAVPHLYDGLKPVQRRILHAMRELDDGRYNKVANVVGHTMQYHPHGDASIAGALVSEYMIRATGSDGRGSMKREKMVVRRLISYECFVGWR